MTDNIFSKAKDSVSAIKDKMTDWGDEQKKIMQEFKDSGTDKIKEVLENIGGSSAIFLQSGYELKSVNINLGLPPVIVATFHFLKDVSEDEQKRVLDETKKSSMIHLIITCLLKASDYFDKIKVGDYKMNSVAISLGLAPGININFTK
ncbi:MAG: hypothetical protein P4L35_20125 [Ignavibacteriaceae bacterium]|nr:hypothetical protein [Ignavibacteriaceae bacterium]